jgi:outer membrane receptor for ferrienterochelin and colicins
MGMEFRQDLGQQQLNYDIQPYHLYLNNHTSSWVAAPYFQDEYSMRSNLTFVVGLRADWDARFETTLSPRVGLLFAATPNTAIRANYSWAFRDPNSYEDFYSGNNTNTPNPALQPENIRSWELDIDHDFSKTYRLSIAGFLNRFDNLITASIDSLTDNLIYLNSTPLESKGIELEVGAKWRNGVEGSISDSVQESQNVLTHTAVTNSPRHLAKANFSVPLVQRKFFVSADAQYVSARTTVAQTKLGGYFVTDVTFFARNLTHDLDISGGLYNAFNKRYSESGNINTVETSIPLDGRSFRVKLTYRPHLSEK